FGDINEDGEAQNPGDGFGVFVYAQAVAAAGDRIAETPDVEGAPREAAVAVGVCGRTVVSAWGRDATEAVLRVLAAGDAEEAQAAGEATVAAIEGLVNGADTNGDGEVQPVRGECGVLQVRETFDAALAATR
ncbi:MAG TPA: hypothetical protein VNK95_08660, partial [Caldilineaceae bacterium]|nr:hypothetical protein [Caldilineaceae bacterium]